MTDMTNVVLEWKALSGFFDDANLFWLDRIKPDLFTNERSAIFSAIKKAYVVYGSITVETIQACYERDLPSQLFIPVAPNIEATIDELTRLAKKRHLLKLAQDITILAQTYDPDLEQVQNVVSFSPVIDNRDSTVGEGVTKFLTSLYHKQNGLYRFISTGFGKLDLVLGGEWKRKAVTLIGALPGTGKTALACDSMLRMARQGNASLFISLEMPKEDLVSRLVSNMAQVDGDYLALGTLDEQEQQKVEHAAQELSKLPIYIIDTDVYTYLDVVAAIKQNLQHGIRTVFIDHLQMFRTDINTRNSALGDIVEGLKELAKAYDLSIVILTQLTKKDGGYSVRDTGNAEAITDVFILLSTDSDTDVRIVDLAFKKHRGGKLGGFPLKFLSKYQQFLDGEENNVWQRNNLHPQIDE